jgi:hypothetical protein
MIEGCWGINANTEMTNVPEVAALDTDHTLDTLLTGEVPTPLERNIIQGSEHEPLGLRIGISKPWAGAKSQNGSLALDRDLGQLDGLGAQKACPSIRQLTSDFIKDGAKVNTGVKTNVQIKRGTARA